jgi:hypothetical protein
LSVLQKLTTTTASTAQNVMTHNTQQTRRNYGGQIIGVTSYILYILYILYITPKMSRRLPQMQNRESKQEQMSDIQHRVPNQEVYRRQSRYENKRSARIS